MSEDKGRSYEELRADLSAHMGAILEAWAKKENLSFEDVMSMAKELLINKPSSA